ATSNVLFRSLKLSSSCQLKSHGTRIRWPLDEMGRNSERPWVIPSTMACRRGMWGWAGVATVASTGAQPRSIAAQADVGDDQGDAGGTAGQPFQVRADGGDVLQHALQGGGDGRLAHGLGQSAVPD